MQNDFSENKKNIPYSLVPADDRNVEPQDESMVGSVSWTASEFIDHEKKSNWYLFLIMATIIVAGLLFLITHQIISPLAVVVLALLFGIYGNAKPRSLKYVVDASGVTVEKKHFNYDAFKGVEIIKDSIVPEISFTPIKRIAVPLTIYYPKELEDEIVGLVSTFLPLNVKRADAIDRLIARLRF